MKKEDKFKWKQQKPGYSQPSCQPQAGFLYIHHNQLKLQSFFEKKIQNYKQTQISLPFWPFIFSIFFSRAIFAFCPLPPPMAQFVLRYFLYKLEEKIGFFKEVALRETLYIYIYTFHSSVIICHKFYKFYFQSQT